MWRVWYNIIAGEDKEETKNSPYKNTTSIRTFKLYNEGLDHIIRARRKNGIPKGDRHSKMEYQNLPASILLGGGSSPKNNLTISQNSLQLPPPASSPLPPPATSPPASPPAIQAAPSVTAPVAPVAATASAIQTAPSASAPAAPSTPADKVFHNFLLNTILHFRRKANKTKDKYGYTEEDYEIAYFKFAIANAKKAIEKSYNIKLDLQQNLADNKISVHDIVCDYKPSRFPYPDARGFNTIYRPNDDLYLYGMQLPHQFNRKLLLISMIYLFHLKIYNIADLHGCADAINMDNPRMGIGIGCNPYDRDCEPQMWDIARRLTLSQPESKCLNIQATATLSQATIDNYELKLDELKYLEKGIYYDIKIRDMTAGHLWSWNEIFKIKDVSRPENSIVVHCLAGAGRTASVMLYLLLRDTRNCLDQTEKQEYETDIKDRLAKPHFGLKNIAEVMGMLSAYFLNYNSNIELATGELFKLGSKIIDKRTADLLKQNGVDDTLIQRILTQGIDTNIRKFLEGRGVEEATIKELEKRQIKSLATSSLLRQRLNRIFFFLAKEFDVKTFYTYGRPTTQVSILPNDEFSNTVPHTVSDWSNYDRDEARKWIS